MPLTDDQIERRVERMVDHLDGVFLAGNMTRRDYDLAIRDLNGWAEAKHLERLRLLRHAVC